METNLDQQVDDQQDLSTKSEKTVIDETLSDPLATSVSSVSSTSSDGLPPPPPPDDNPLAAQLAQAFGGPVDKEQEEKRHREMAKNTAAALEKSDGNLEDKKKQALDLSAFYTTLLRDPITMDVDFVGAPVDGEQTADIVIAPNDTRRRTTFSVTRKLSDITAEDTEDLSDDERGVLQGHLDGADGEQRNEIEILLRLADVITGRRKAGEDESILENDALGFIMQLAEKPPGVRTSVVMLLGADFGDLLRKANLATLWSTPNTAEATTTLLQDAPDAVAKVIIKELLATGIFDWSVDRYEARLAWELVLTLPESERMHLVTDDIPDKIKRARIEGTHRRERLTDEEREQNKNRKLQKRVQNRIPRNLSKEYMESSRYDLFNGNEQGSFSDVADDADSSVKEKKTKELDAYTEATGVKGEDIVLDDSGREGLLAKALDPGLWTDAPQAQLRAILGMVIQADEAAFVRDLVRTHWAAHEALFLGLGFHSDGRFVEDIQDDTYSTMLGRLLAGVQSFFDVIGVLGLIFNDKDAATVNLVNATTAFRSSLGGLFVASKTADLVEIRDTFNEQFEGIPVEEIEKANKTTVADILLGTVGATAKVLDLTGWGSAELVDVLKTGRKAGGRLQVAIDNQQIMETVSGESPETDPEMANKMIVSQDDLTGSTRISVPLLPISGQVKIFGENTIKTGAAALIGADIELKMSTANDNRRHMRAVIKSVGISDLDIVTPQDMLTIGSITLDNLLLEADLEDAKPASVLTRILFNIQNAIISILQLIPGQIGAVGGQLGRMSDLISMSLAADAISEGNVTGLTFSFGKAAVKGIASSGGDFVEEISIGATSLTASPELSALLDWKDEGALDEEIENIDEEREKLLGRLAKDPGEYATTVLTQQVAWLDDRRAGLQKRLDNYEGLSALHDKLAPKATELAALEEKDPESRTEADVDRMAVLAGEIPPLQIEMSLLMGAKAEGTLGAVDVKNVDWGGMKIGAAHMSETSIKTVTKDGETASSVVASNDSITLTDVSIGSGERRDQLIPGEIVALDEKLAEVNKQMAELKAQRLSATQAGVYRSLDDNRVSLEKRKGLLQQELSDLQPVLAEYDLLRSRLTDHDNPLDGLERERLLALRERLSQKDTTSIGSVTITDLKADVSIGSLSEDNLDDAGLKAEISAGKVEMTDITMSGSSEYAEDGTTTIDKITLSSNTEGEQGVALTGDLTGGLRDGTLNARADKIEVSEIKTEGLSDVVGRQTDDVEAQLVAVRAEIARLEAMTDPSDADTARLATLRQQQTTLEQRESALGARKGEKEALLAFAEKARGRLGDFTDSDKNDRSRSYSLKSAIDSNKSIAQQIRALRNGTTGAEDEVSERNALLLVERYATAAERLEAQRDQLDGIVDARLDVDLIDERAEDAFEDMDLKTVEAQLKVARKLQETWEDNLKDVRTSLGALGSKQRGQRLLEKNYRTLIDDAIAAGVGRDSTVDPKDLDAVERAAQKQQKNLSKLSAEGVMQTALSQAGAWDSSRIKKVSASDVNVQITGFENATKRDENGELEYNDGTWAGPIELRGNNEDGTLVKDLAIEGVYQGDNEEATMESLNLSGLKGTIGVQQLREDYTRITIKGFEMGQLALASMHWKSPDYGIDTDGGVIMKDMSADITVNMVDGAMTGTVHAFDIGSVVASEMDLDYGDYKIHLGATIIDGKEVPGEAELSALSVRDYDLVKGTFDEVAINGLTNSGLEADLGGGIKIGAESLDIGSLKIGAMSTSSGKAEHQLKQQEEIGEDGLMYDGSTDDAYANVYTMDINDLDADQFRVQLDEMGIDAQITKLSGGITGFSMDMTTGVFGLDKVSFPTLSVGPIEYSSGGTDFSADGMSMRDVQLSAHGKLLFSEREKEELEASTGKVPDYVRDLVLSDVSARSVVASGLDLTTTDDDSKTTVSVPTARIDALSLSKYDYNSGAVSAAVKGVDIDQVGVSMTDAMSTTTLTGGVSIGSLSYGTVYDGSGKAIGSGVDFNDVDADVDMGYRGIDLSDGKTSSTELKMKKMAIGTASGSVKMTEETGDDGIKRDIKSFSGVTLGSLDLGTVTFATGGGDTTSLSGKNLEMDGLAVTGTYASWTEPVRTAGGVLPMPKAALTIKSLDMKALEADEITYVGTTLDDEGNPTVDTVALGEDGKAIIQGVKVKDLLYADGLKNGEIEVESVDSDVSYSSESVVDEVSSTLETSSKIQADKLWMNVSTDDSGKTSTKLGSNAPLKAEGVSITHDNEGHRAEITAPEVTVTGVSAELLDRTTDDEINSLTSAHVGMLNFDQDANIEYFTKDTGPEKEATEMSNDELTGAIQSAEDLHRRFSTLDWEGLLSTVNGEIACDFNVDNNVDVVLNIEPIPFLDLLPDLVLPTSELDLKDNRIGIPVIDGYVNLLLMKADSGVLMNMALNTLQMLLLGPAGVITDLIPINLAWFADTIGGALEPDEELQSIKQELFWRNFLERMYAGAGMDPAETRQRLDDGAAAEYAARVQADQAELAVIAAELEAQNAKYAKFAKGLKSVSLVSAQYADGHESAMDVYLDSFDIDLSGGPVNGQSLRAVVAGMDTQAAHESISLDSFDLDFKDVGDGLFEAGVTLNKLRYSEVAGTVDNNWEATELGVGKVSLGAGIDNLFPNGRITLAGGNGEDMMENPITSTIKKDSYISDLDIAMQKIYRRK